MYPLKGDTRDDMIEQGGGEKVRRRVTVARHLGKTSFKEEK